MDRRQFLATGAAAAAAVSFAGTASAERAAGVEFAELDRVGDGKKITLRGFMGRPADGTHYFVLGERANPGDPRCGDASGWDRGMIKVYPAKAGRFVDGERPIAVTGRLFKGAFKDEATGHASALVMTDATFRTV